MSVRQYSTRNYPTTMVQYLILSFIDTLLNPVFTPSIPGRRAVSSQPSSFRAANEVRVKLINYGVKDRRCLKGAQFFSSVIFLFSVSRNFKNEVLKINLSGTGTSTLFNEEIMERFIVADEELHDTPCQTERIGDRCHQDR